MTLQKLFGGLRMSWPAVLLSAAAVGIYTGAVMLIPALKDTSFQDIGVTYEWWVIFAVILVVNCKTSVEAMLKCFVFFLVSQPLVYAVEVVFGALTVEQAAYYLSIWLPMTLATLPGGFIAFFCKKQTALGAVILGIGNTIQAVMGLSYAAMAVGDFPHHLLSALISFASIFLMTRGIRRTKRGRCLTLLTTASLTALLLVFALLTDRLHL